MRTWCEVRNFAWHREWEVLVYDFKVTKVYWSSRLWLFD